MLQCINFLTIGIGMIDYNDICKKTKWTSLKTIKFEDHLAEFLSLIDWFFATPKVPGKHQKSAAVFAARLWNACDSLQKQKIAKVVVNSDGPDSCLFSHCMGLSLLSAQYIYEQKINARLAEPKAIGSGEVKRLIALHAKYINDDEVLDALFLYLNKHGFETCAIVTSIEILEEYIQKNIETLVCLGHGFRRDPSVIYDCGPIDGVHDQVVAKWSKILKKYPHVSHMRLLYCYYGSPNPAFDLEKQEEQVEFNAGYASETGRVTATIKYNPLRPCPFHPESFAGMLWEKVVMEGRRQDFCLSATPLILNPLPAKKPEFFAACDVDHYHLPPLSKCGMWSDPNLSVLHKTKAIRLVTADSNKLSR